MQPHLNQPKINHFYLQITYFNAVISTLDGPKGVPIAADALFIRASDLANAFSTASEGELLACGLTSGELEDLQIKSTSVSFVETQKSSPSWQ